MTSRPKRPERTPFLEHVREFRVRLGWVALVVIGFAVGGFFIHEQLISFLLKPAAEQQFIYTTPGGGLNFLIQVCVYFGITAGIPVIIYHVLRYLEPLLKRNERGFVMKCTLFSAVLALTGMSFGYFIGLPAALHFLTNEFQTERITALLTVSDYLSFVIVYMVGSALMFQIPVVLLFINRIKPLSPRKLLASQRWVVLLAFVAAAIITPTPDIINQIIVAGPIILVYQIGVIIVGFQNRYSRKLKAHNLALADEQLRLKRQQTAEAASHFFEREQLVPTVREPETRTNSVEISEA